MKTYTQEEIDQAIEIYKSTVWTTQPNCCEDCGRCDCVVKLDSEASRNLCEKCLEIDLRKDLQGLFDTIDIDHVRDTLKE